MNSSTEPVNYDISLIKFPVTYRGTKMWATEADGEAAGKYRAASLRGVEMDIKEDGSRTSKKMDSIVDTEPVLVSQCLYLAGDDGELRLNSDGDPEKAFLVPLSKVKKFPSRLQKELFERIKSVSDLDESDTVEKLDKEIAKLQARKDKLLAKEGELKNSSSTTVRGSD